MGFEYKDKTTGEHVSFAKRLTEEEMEAKNLKRVWSVGFQIKTVDWGH